MKHLHPVCVGMTKNGELAWAWVRMELWQIIQFYRRQYQGDFGEQWMRLCLYNHGMGWDE